MKRRDFIHLAGMGAGAMMLPLPSVAHHIHPEDLLKPGMDVQQKKQLS